MSAVQRDTMPELAMSYAHQWWADCGNIARLYRWLVDHDEIDPSQDREVEYFISKPWKWDNEWRDLIAQEGA